MPVTKTAKRALRGSKRKTSINVIIKTQLDKTIRLAEKSRSAKDVSTAISLADRAAKKQVIHDNKAARIKSRLNKLASRQTKKVASVKKPSSQKTASK